SYERQTGDLINERTLNVFFFFQAEDGIRDSSVTGVQTCALPIYPGSRKVTRRSTGFCRQYRRATFRLPGCLSTHNGRYRPCRERSEERRVGKECRWREWEKHEKEKKNKS